MENFQKGITSDYYNRTRLVVFIVIVVILGVSYLLLENNFSEKTAKRDPVPSDTLQKRVIVDKSIPKEFSDKVPLIPGSDLVETYTLFDSTIENNTDGVVVLNSTKSPNEILKYYQDQLTPPDFQFVQGSDKNNTETLKILVFSVKTGVVTIKIEKIESGAKVTIRNSNLLIKTSNIK